MYEPYRNPYAQAIAEAIAAPYTARAKAEIEAAQNTSELVGSLAKIGTNTLGTLMKWQEDKPKRARETAEAALETQKVKDLQQAQADKEATARAVANHPDDRDAAVRELNSLGQIRAGSLLQKQVFDERRQGIKDQQDRLTLANSQLERAGRIFPEPPADASDPIAVETFRRQYANILPELQRTIGADLSKNLPDPTDPDVVAKATVARTQGLSIQERTQARLAGLQTAELGIKAAKESRDADPYNIVAGGKWLATAESPEVYRGIYRTLAAPIANGGYGASVRVLQKFIPPDQVTPETLPAAIEKAVYWRDSEKKAMTPAQQAANDIAKQNADRAAAALDETKRHNRVTEDKPPGGSPDLSAAGKATAERWKAQQLGVLENQARDPISPMSADQLATGKLRIENGYRAQLGLPALTELPASWQATPPIAAPPTATPTPKPSPSPAQTAASALEGQARTLIASIRTKEAAGQDATAERGQLARLRSQVK